MQINQATIIGVGGTGQLLLAPLIRLLKYHTNGTTDVKAYDGDRFEPHNVERQIGVAGPKVNQMNEALSQQGLSPICIDRYMTLLHSSISDVRLAARYW